MTESSADPSTRDLAAVLAREFDAGSVPGAAVAVTTIGGVTAVASAGRRWVDGPPVDEDTVFEVASLTKPVVASYLFALAHERAVGLDESIRYDPADFGAELDPRFAAITPRHLLTHAAGLPNWRDPGAPLRLIATPGTEVNYSGEGFELLLAWLAARRGEAVVAAELAEVCDRHGLVPSSFVWRREYDVLSARPHDASARLLPKWRPTRPTGAGSLHCTVRGYAEFIRRWMMAGTGTEDRGRAWRSPDRHRSLTWAVARDDAGEVLWQHGDSPGLKHLAALRPASGLGAVVMTNGDLGGDLAARIIEQIVKTAPLWPRPRRSTGP